MVRYRNKITPNITNQGVVIPPRTSLTIPADQLVVDIEAKESPMDEFVDDIITIAIDDTSWFERAKNTDLLVIRNTFGTLQYLEHLKRDDPISLHKLAYEDLLTKQKTCLF